MSYVVAIWDQPPGLPLPGDIDAATRLVDMLYRVRPGPNPKYIELIRRLTARYPDITSPEAEELGDDQLAWIDGPLSGETDDCVYNLGIGTGDLFEEVRPFVIETARELGLHVFDTQAGEAYFADGTWVGAHERRTTGIERAVMERLAPYLRKHGYEMGADGEMLRQSDTGWYKVGVVAGATWPPHYDLYFEGRHDNWAISDLYGQISFDTPKPLPGAPREVGRGPLGIIHQHRWVERGAPFVSDKGGFRVRGVSELDIAIPAIASQLERGVLRLLALSETIEGYDALMNPAALAESPFFIEKVFHGWERGYRNVLAAHLAGNPRLHEICAAVEAGLEGESAWSTVFYNTRKCIDYVRRERGLQWGNKR